MYKLFSFFLNWLGGGVLTSVLGHLEKRAALQNDRERMKTEITIDQIKSELAIRQEQAAVIKLQLGHPIAWFPRFAAEMTAVLYFSSHVIDSVWDLAGTVAELPTNEAAIIGVIFSGMFLKATFGKA
jgi:hypothetical protein